MGMSLPEEDQTKWWESDECEDDGASEKMIDAEEDELDNCLFSPPPFFSLEFLHYSVSGQGG